MYYQVLSLAAECPKKRLDRLPKTIIGELVIYLDNRYLPFLQIQNGNHKVFRIVDFTITNIKNFNLSKIVDYVPVSNLSNQIKIIAHFI